MRGSWPFAEARRLTHWLRKEGRDGFERVRVSDQPGDGREAVLTAVPLERGAERSLLLLRLHTGRTHQIRAQLAHVGHAVLGDIKYGTPDAAPHLMLHALRVILPDGEIFACLPEWEKPFAVRSLPAAPDMPLST